MRSIPYALSAVIISVAAHSAAAAAERDTQFGTNEALDKICVEQVNPADSSGFTTYALNAQSSSEQITEDVGDTYIVPLGDPTTVIDGLTGPVHVNGQSPNIWAYYNRIVRYLDGAEVRVNRQTFTRTTLSASGCHVHKPGAGNSQVEHDPLPGHGDFNAPPGLQINTAFGSTSDGPATPAGFRVVSTIPGPYDDPNNVVDEQALICISPSTTTKKGAPGDWVAKHGFNGTLKTIGGADVSVGGCSRALYNSAAANTNPPTNSLPTN